MRHKEVHAINTHPSLKFALDFGMSLISEKIKKRVKIYTSLEEAINHKMDTSLLPKEYGGTMPMKEMIGKYIYILSCVHRWIIIRGREKKREKIWSDYRLICRIVEEGIARYDADIVEPR